MGQLVFQATLGGQVNLVGPNTASTFNLNVPAVSSTLATLAAQTFAGTQTFTVDASISGLTVGKGNNSVSNNTAVGLNALSGANSGSGLNTAVGTNVLASNTSGQENSALGVSALGNNSTGSSNTAIGRSALANTTASNNTAVGYQAGYTGNGTYFQYSTLIGYQAGYTSSPSSASSYGNTCIGAKSGYSLTTGYGNILVGGIGSGGSDPTGFALTTGINNTFIGPSSGNEITTGSKNSILGKYSGNQGGLDIRTASNYIVLSDGDGNPLAYTQSGKTFVLPSGTISSGTGIAFPATQSASSDANTLDDYEEGTWTPVIVPGSGSITSQSGTGYYVKVGRMITIQYNCVLSNAGTASGSFNITSLPFTAINSDGKAASNIARENALTGVSYQVCVTVNSTNITISTLSTNNPASWTSSSQYTGSVTYETTS